MSGRNPPSSDTDGGGFCLTFATTAFCLVLQWQILPPGFPGSFLKYPRGPTMRTDFQVGLETRARLQSYILGDYFFRRRLLDCLFKKLGIPLLGKQKAGRAKKGSGTTSPGRKFCVKVLEQNGSQAWRKSKRYPNSRDDHAVIHLYKKCNWVPISWRARPEA